VKRGDIVTVAAGKPRPAVVVQSDHLLPYPMIIVVPMTSEVDVRPPPFTRMTIDPNPTNGLKRVSQIMVDRIIGLPVAQLRPTPGRLEDDKLTELTRLLALWLGIG
jgi:mRNA interferase MazF